MQSLLQLYILKKLYYVHKTQPTSSQQMTWYFFLSGISLSLDWVGTRESAAA